MTTKNFFISTVSGIIVSLLIVAGIQIVIDPLFLYHKPYFGLQPVITNERYQNAGIAKHFDYDNVIIGNSMSENFRASWFDERLGGNTVKLTASGSRPLDWKDLLNIIANREKHPDFVIMNLDNIVLTGSLIERRFEQPDYLYNDTFLDDVKYWFNFSIWKDFTTETILRNYNHDIPDINEVFVWDEGTQCGTDIFWTHYGYSQEELLGVEKARDTAMSNIELLEPYFREMKDTRFIFFCSPWSMIYWRDSLRSESEKETRAAFDGALSKLEVFPNVSIYQWRDEEMIEIMTDMNNYKDPKHYSGAVSNLIAERICTSYGEVEKGAYQIENAKFFDYIENYDYSRWQE